VIGESIVTKSNNGDKIGQTAGYIGMGLENCSKAVVPLCCTQYFTIYTLYKDGNQLTYGT